MNFDLLGENEIKNKSDKKLSKCKSELIDKASGDCIE